MWHVYSCIVLRRKQAYLVVSEAIISRTADPPPQQEAKYPWQDRYMIALHVFLILRRLKQENARSQATAQALFDTMFTDMDRGLRELGAGDLGVGRRVKVMAKAFYGRVAAYDRGLKSDDGDLNEAILRNIFRGQEDERDRALLIASYTRRQADALDHQSVDALLEGEVLFITAAISDDGKSVL